MHTLESIIYSRIIIPLTHLKYSFYEKIAYFFLNLNTKFVLCDSFVSSMPEGAWRHFWGKMNIPEISSLESLGRETREILQNVPEQLAKL